MTCTEYVEAFSEIYDGTASLETVREAESHLASCTGCSRYRRVLERGSEILRELPEPEVREDFAPRLQHRLFHADQEALLHRHTHSGSSALAVLGIAVILVAVAWAPALRPSAPVVELPPIVVDMPPPGARARPVASFSAFSVNPPTSSLDAALWGDARTLLFQYSRLAQRYGQRSSLGRLGLEQQ